MKKRKFKIHDRVKLRWDNNQLEAFGLDRIVIIRRYCNDYSERCYYVSGQSSRRLFLVYESDLKKISK